MSQAKTFSAAIYARRKFTDVIQPGESDPTADEQVAQAKSFLSNLPDVQLGAVYMDRQPRPQDSERQEFTRLNQDLRAAKYDCLIITSVDIFARDYAESCSCLLHTFAAMGIRIISIQDDYDSTISEPVSGQYERLKELICQLDSLARSRMKYARIRKKQAADYITLRGTPYGYLYTEKEGPKWIPDPETAPHVRYIFSEYLSGTTPNHIAKALTAMGVSTPINRKRELSGRPFGHGVHDYWSSSSVIRILSSTAYVGTRAVGKDSQALCLQKDPGATGGTAVVVEGDHEALISNEDFDRVQLMLQLVTPASDRHLCSNPATAGLQTPFPCNVYCGVCGRLMIHRIYETGRINYATFKCASQRMNLDNPCTYEPLNHTYVVDTVTEIVRNEGITARRIALEMEETSQHRQRIEAYFQARIAAATETYRLNTEQIMSLSPEDAEREAALEAEAANTRATLLEAISDKDAFFKTFRKSNPWLTAFSEVPEDLILTKEWSRKLIQRIDVYPDQPPVVTFKYADEKKKLLAYLEIGKEDTDGTKKQTATSD